MFDSKAYWENRYATGGNSGCGSYNKLAEFKAGVINEFIRDNNITSIIDYGVGDGNQLKLIDTRDLQYTGIDVSSTVIEKCIDVFKGDPTKKFSLDDSTSNLTADLTMSCDVLYHLIENEI